MALTTEYVQNVKKIRDITGAALQWCKIAYDTEHQDFDKAIEAVCERMRTEGRAFTLSGPRKPASNGRVVADVNAGGNEGIILALSCVSEQAAKSELLIDTLDNIMIVAFNDHPDTISQLLGCFIDNVIGNIKDSTLTKDNTVEDLLNDISIKLKEDIQIEYYTRMTQMLGSGQYTFIAPYNHHNNLVASLCSFIISTKSSQKDVDWLKLRILSTIACYNPLCIHYYTITDSIKQYVKNSQIKDVVESFTKNGQKVDERVVEHQADWALNSFLESVILDNIKIQSVPFQELNKPKEEENSIPMETIGKLCADHGLLPLDFERYQIKINKLSI